MVIGRELDALISKVIFGEEYPFNDFFQDYSRPWVEDPIAFENCPHYSTDISEAWKVVEKLLSILSNASSWVFNAEACTK